MSSETQNGTAEPELTPEEFIDHLRALRARVREVTPLTAAQRKTLQFRLRMSEPVLSASINVIDVVDNISLAIDTPAAELREMRRASLRWTAAEDELRSLLAGISGANLVRRDRIMFLATQGAVIASRLARDPAHAVLVPYVEELRRLKRLERRRKPEPSSETPSPEPPSPPADVE